MLRLRILAILENLDVPERGIVRMKKARLTSSYTYGKGAVVRIGHTREHIQGVPKKNCPLTIFLVQKMKLFLCKELKLVSFSTKYFDI